MGSWIRGVPPHKILYNRSGCGTRVAPMMWNSMEVMDIFSNFGCYFGFMQISAHKLKGTGALLHLACWPNTLLLAQSEVISNIPNMRKYMLRNTATCLNSINNNNRNHRITVILALCKLCILHFLTLSRWKMRIQVKCVFEEYQILKKLYKSNKNSDHNYLNHTHFEFMQIMHIC